MTTHTLNHSPRVLPGLGHLVANLHFFSAANHRKGEVDLPGNRRGKRLASAAPIIASDPIILPAREGPLYVEKRWSHEAGVGGDRDRQTDPVARQMPFMKYILSSLIHTRFEDQLELELHAIYHSCHPLPVSTGYLNMAFVEDWNDGLVEH